MNKSDLVELKYLSRAQEKMHLSTLAEITDVSRARNEPNGITGILFFDHGYYGQILEGERVVVEEKWIRIKNDARHYDIELLGIKEIQDRRFPKWSMKLFNAQEFKGAFPQFAELISKMDDPDAENIRILKSLWQNI